MVNQGTETQQKIVFYHHLPFILYGALAGAG
jgi:hypothetical protein